MEDGRGKRGEGEREGRLKSRMKELKRNMEKRKKKERRRNVIIKNIEVKEGKEREAITELLKGIAA